MTFSNSFEVLKRGVTELFALTLVLWILCERLWNLLSWSSLKSFFLRSKANSMKLIWSNKFRKWINSDSNFVIQDDNLWLLRRKPNYTNWRKIVNWKQDFLPSFILVLWRHIPDRKRTKRIWKKSFQQNVQAKW